VSGLQQDSNGDAERLFAEFVVQHSGCGDREFDAFCAQRPVLAAKLRELRETWRQGEKLVHFAAAAAPCVTQLLRQLHGPAADPAVELDAPCGPESGTAAQRRLEELAAHAPAKARYSIGEEIARGGMGAIYRAWDQDLRRSLAMKVMLQHTLRKSSENSSRLARFLEEAQITGQLDHPGIVPVHELGMDEKGQVYFTMRLVRGENLRAIFERVHSETEAEWTLGRALGVIVRVCETLAFAHRKGVIHRDLKPSNIMVGRFGETYVMDWGLAKVVGHADLHDLRPRSETPSMSAVRTERSSDPESSDAPLITMDGDIVGTPSYMSPEQASGRVEEIDTRSDVYSVGAMLYHLLTNQRPYMRKDERASAYTILNAVRTGPPTPIEKIKPETPAELLAICEKAMHRDPKQRYQDVLAMAEDLRAFIEGRVVRAYETGARAEFKKWVVRNKGMAAGVAAALLATFAGLIGVVAVQAAGKATAMRERTRADDMALEGSRRAREAADALARERPFADSFLLQELVQQSDSLWPALPSKVGAYREWLAAAAGLRERLPAHREAVQALEQRAIVSAPDPREPPPEERTSAQIQNLEVTLQTIDAMVERGNATQEILAERDRVVAEIEAHRRELEAPPKLTFTDPTDHRMHTVLAELTLGIERLQSQIASMEHRLSRAQTLEEESLESQTARERWQRAMQEIRSDPAFYGLVLEPQRGLLPLRRDPRSGLWEFAHLLSGEPPWFDPEGGPYAITAETGLVLVLLPGGYTGVGCCRQDHAHEMCPRVDPQRSSLDGPLWTVLLSPFFFSKYEMTKAQWMRVMERDPSALNPSSTDLNEEMLATHPIESASWYACEQALARLDLCFPTEVQWEYACRAGTSTPYFTGTDPHSLAGYANIADRTTAQMVLLSDWTYERDFDDGYAATAPVDELKPNGFGLHHIQGNVSEWTRSHHHPESSALPRNGDGLREVEVLTDHMIHRGGSWSHGFLNQRSAARMMESADSNYYFIGLRPARAVQR
jgi:serine/threonine protein kinase/formylglycine-generating enzyme required for sulfatase activity